MPTIAMHHVNHADLGEQENGEFDDDGRVPHSFAEECRSGTGLGHVFGKQPKP